MGSDFNTAAEKFDSKLILRGARSSRLSESIIGSINSTNRSGEIDNRHYNMRLFQKRIIDTYNAPFDFQRQSSNSRKLRFKHFRDINNSALVATTDDSSSR